MSGGFQRELGGSQGAAYWEPRWWRRQRRSCHQWKGGSFGIKMTKSGVLTQPWCAAENKPSLTDPTIHAYSNSEISIHIYVSWEIQPARHNHQQTNQQGTKWASKAYMCPRKHILGQTRISENQWGTSLTKNAYFGPNLAVFGPKILISTGGSKIFGTHVTEKPPRHRVCIVSWLGMGRNGPKMPIFSQKW